MSQEVIFTIVYEKPLLGGGYLPIPQKGVYP